MLKVEVVVVVLVVVMAGGLHSAHSSNVNNNKGNTGRQYHGGFSSGNNNWGYGYGSNNNNVQQQQQTSSNNINNGYYTNSDYSNLLQQYDVNSGYYDSFASRSDYAQEPSYAPAATYNTGTVAVDNPDSSPALSALALLGFLYFLNLIQDVLQNNNNGRRRRSTHPVQEAEEEELYYSTSYLEDGLIFEDPESDFNISSDLVKESEEQVQSEQVEMRDESRVHTSEKEDGNSEEQSENSEEQVQKDQEHETEGDHLSDSEVAPRSLSYLEDFFIRLPQVLGLRPKPPVDRDGRDGKKPVMDIGGFFTSRLKMISSIMSFLQDPSPTRVRRDVQDLDPVGSAVAGQEGLSAWLTPSLTTFVPIIQEAVQGYLMPEKHSTRTRENDVSGGRHKRHTHFMNTWYDDLHGRSVEVSSGMGGIAAKMTSLLGGGAELEEAARKDAAPALLELTRGLSGSHPHCLQRALCRLNTHAHKLSLMPRLAMQLLSNSLAESSTSANLVEDNTRAIQAGRQGEDCTEMFPQCKTSVKV